MAAGSRDDRAVAAMAGGAPVRRRGRGQKGALAWAYLGPNPAYREAWAAHAVPPAFEDAPIVCRAAAARGRWAWFPTSVDRAPLESIPGSASPQSAKD